LQVVQKGLTFGIGDVVLRVGSSAHKVQDLMSWYMRLYDKKRDDRIQINYTIEGYETGIKEWMGP